MFVVTVDINFHHDYSIVSTNCLWVSEDGWNEGVTRSSRFQTPSHPFHMILSKPERSLWFFFKNCHKKPFPHMNNQRRNKNIEHNCFWKQETLGESDICSTALLWECPTWFLGVCFKKTEMRRSTLERLMVTSVEVPQPNTLNTLNGLSHFLVCFPYVILLFLLGQLLSRTFKIQVLPAAFYLSENVDFKQSATGKICGCCGGC